MISDISTVPLNNQNPSKANHSEKIMNRFEFLWDKPHAYNTHRNGLSLTHPTKLDTQLVKRERSAEIFLEQE